jgi:hypothetical protein
MSSSSTSSGTFDDDRMDLVNNRLDLDSSLTDTHLYAETNTTIAGALKLERKSRLRRMVDRLRVKNAALKSTVTQVKSDLALERQKRSTMDQIYSRIRKDLCQKLESEEIKAFNLKFEVEQMNVEMRELKDQLAATKRTTAFSRDDGIGSSRQRQQGYKIGYDSSTFLLSGGITNIGGLMLHHHSNLDLIDGQDGSEEFFFSHSYSPSTVQTLDYTITAPMTDLGFTSRSHTDDDHAKDMENDDEDDEDNPAAKGDNVAPTQKPSCSLLSNASRRTNLTSTKSLPTLTEEEEEEECDGAINDLDGDPYDANDMDSEHEDAPRTMMEIILQRQRSRSPEDDMEIPPADVNETFETMAQRALLHAIQSKLTVAQTQLQLEELILKFDARLEQTIQVLAKEISRWWEAERLATGGPISGGWGQERVIIGTETGEYASPKAAIEKRVELFFGPLLLQFVASAPEQRMLLDKLGEHASGDTRWIKNHSSVLVALYKYDVIEAEAILEWWQDLDEPQGVFGHGGNNLRSLVCLLLCLETAARLFVLLD